LAILGISHFVIATEGGETDAQALCAVGNWSFGMVAVGLPIDPGKAGYLTGHHALHDLRLMRHAAAAPGVEFVRYPELPQRTAHYRVMFGGEDAAPLAAALETDAPVAGPTGWTGAADAAPRRFGLCVADLDRSRRFWAEGIGFRPAGSVGNAESLRFPTFVCGWRNDLLLLPGTPAARPGMLDDRGWNCISLLVDDPLAVGKRLADFGGADLTPEIRVAVPGAQGEGERTLRLRFLRGPDGEIVELLAAGSLLDAA
jgi:catechol 2,3-dioxygenase-like lactoylglutathione lyase family enzyme